jgi:2-C-methyl-D-erythritol 4-phosphate cytidylyltransferase
MGPTVGIIVAGGTGRRMEAARPKQYLLLGSLPILSHTIKAFYESRCIDRVVLVVPEADFDRCRTEVIAPLSLDLPLVLAPGGESRQGSVRNGLRAVSEKEGIVLIHDGVRPFVPPEGIAACIEGARKEGACILAVPVQDTVKRASVSRHVSSTLDRQDLWLAQTPQAFDLPLIRRAHAKALEDGVTATDDASLVERAGARVRIVAGSAANIKITTPGDMRLAESMLHAARFHDEIRAACFFEPEEPRRNLMQDVMNAIRQRRSIRNYEEMDVPEETLHQVLEAVKWSPSWANTQCWEVVVIRDSGIKEKLKGTLLGSNPAGKALVGAPVVLGLCAKRASSGYYKGEATTKFGDWFMYDLGIATQSICLAAHAQGLGAVVVGLFDQDKANAVLGVPQGYDIVSLIPLGFPAKVPSAPKRREVEEFTHQDMWSSPA